MYDLIYMVRCVPQRMKYVKVIQEQIPELIVFQDKDGCAMKSFIKALRLIGERRAILLEDDVLLTSNFKEKAHAVIEQYPDSIINFFTGMSKLVTEAKWRAGSSFSCNPCTYYPKGYGTIIADYYDVWEGKIKHPTGTDIIIADWLKSRKERWYMHYPSLVQHLPGISAIDPRRPRNRKCYTFEP